MTADRLADPSRIRVMLVIARMNVGGPALLVTNQLQGLEVDRFEQRLYVGTVGEGEADYLELRGNGVEIERVPGLGRAPRAMDDLRALAMLVSEMRRFRPDIVHTHTAKAGVLGRLAAEVARIPTTVHSFHGHLLHGYFSPRMTSVVTRTERVLARRTGRLVAVGERVRDELIAAGVGRHDQYVVIPPGVSVSNPPTRAEARARLGLPPDGQVVAFVGRLTRVKRPDRMVEVATRLTSENPDLIFLVCGEGELLDETRRVASHMTDRIRFLGWRRDVEVIYSAADVTLLTSDNEGMPISLIESSLLGVPAVATDVGSVSEVVSHGTTGILTNTSVESITSALRHVLSDSVTRNAMAVAAREFAQERFSCERLIRDTTALYESLIVPSPRN